MKKTSIALVAQTILTLDAGTHRAIQDGGDTYLLIQSSTDISGDAPKAEPKGGENIEEAIAPEPNTTAQTTRQEPAQTASTTSPDKYVEADLMQDKKTIQELVDILEEMGVNPSDYDGKNTNKKLRLLILDAQEGKIVNDEAPVAEPAPTQQATAPRGRGRGASSAPATPRELTQDETDVLDEGDMVIVKLHYEDTSEVDDPDKLWECEVTGWKIPDGETEEKLHVTFQEDGATDWLRDGDVLYEYKVKI